MRSMKVTTKIVDADGVESEVLSTIVADKDNEVCVNRINKGGKPIIVKISGQGQTGTLPALADTGSGADIMGKSVADRLGIVASQPSFLRLKQADQKSYLKNNGICYMAMTYGGDTVQVECILRGDLGSDQIFSFHTCKMLGLLTPKFIAGVGGSETLVSSGATSDIRTIASAAERTKLSAQQAHWYNRGTAALTPLPIGCQVVIQDAVSKHWATHGVTSDFFLVTGIQSDISQKNLPIQ
eukprot:maker-scaffold648_size119863-snap-gene-0.19 protein:Tk05886 transcript:maker-scaffold648_size119863-snap-gene-0.19-mRNA-1 annotation:"hypothetical protein DAPPUDRAFT_264304"